MSKEEICRRICNTRFINAVVCSSALQLILLAVFFLLLNFSLFHPFSWITDTISTLFSIRTLVWLVPLMAVVMLYGISLSDQYLYNPSYYATRAVWIYLTAVRNFTFFGVHILFGFLTAWMHSNYATLKLNGPNCMQQNYYCVHEVSLMSILSGIYVSCYYFFIKGPVHTSFFIIQQNVYIKIRSSVVSILGKSLIQSIGPLFTYFVLYAILRSSIKFYTVATFNVDFEDASIFNLKQIFFLWIVTSHILCNMMSISAIFKVFVERYTSFPINDNKMQSDNEILTLNEALSSKITSIQKLASYDLFTLANASDATRRSQIFALSMPGGHPYNWITLSTTCLQQIDSFYDLLSKSIEQIIFENRTNFNNRLSRPMPVGITIADKVRFRQYNQNYGIRNMSMNGNYSTENPTTEQINDVISKIKLRYAAFKAYIINLPGIYYLFAEKFSSKIDFYLCDTETISWISQGLSSLAAQSLIEDRYGVVHNSLVKIMTTLLKFKKVVDKIYDTRMENKSTRLKCVHLRNTIGRCLFQLCSTFEEHLPDLIADQNDLQQFISIARNAEF